MPSTLGLGSPCLQDDAGSLDEESASNDESLPGDAEGLEGPVKSAEIRGQQTNKEKVVILNTGMP